MNVSRFNVETESLDGNVEAVSITGELDQATASELRGPLHEAIDGGKRAVMIDMSACGFIDSTGLGVIVETWKLLKEQNGERAALTICCPEPEVKRLLEVTGLDEEIAVFETRDEALAALPS